MSEHTKTIFILGAQPADVMTREQLCELMDQIQAAAGDGVEVRLPGEPLWRRLLRRARVWWRRKR